MLINALKYGGIGLTCLALELGLFSFLVNITTTPLIANSIAIIISIMLSFTLNARYNFYVIDNYIRRFVMFIGVNITGLLISNIFLFILLRLCNNPLYAKLLSIPPVVVYQFCANSLWTFRKNIKTG